MADIVWHTRHFSRNKCRRFAHKSCRKHGQRPARWHCPSFSSRSFAYPWPFALTTGWRTGTSTMGTSSTSSVCGSTVSDLYRIRMTGCIWGTSPAADGSSTPSRPAMRKWGTSWHHVRTEWEAKASPDSFLHLFHSCLSHRNANILLSCHFSSILRGSAALLHPLLHAHAGGHRRNSDVRVVLHVRAPSQAPEGTSLGLDHRSLLRHDSRHHFRSFGRFPWLDARLRAQLPIVVLRLGRGGHLWPLPLSHALLRRVQSASQEAARHDVAGDLLNGAQSVMILTNKKWVSIHNILPVSPACKSFLVVDWFRPSKHTTIDLFFSSLNLVFFDMSQHSACRISVQPWKVESDNCNLFFTNLNNVWLNTQFFVS